MENIVQRKMDLLAPLENNFWLLLYLVQRCVVTSLSSVFSFCYTILFFDDMFGGFYSTSKIYFAICRVKEGRTQILRYFCCNALEISALC